MNNKTPIAIVTGSSRGLGRNTAIHLAKSGTDVILTYNSNRAEADSAVAEIEALGRRAVALQLDAGNTKSFDGFVGKVRKALADTWQRDSFDHLVNNAGIGYNASIAETTEDAFDRLVNIHFKGVFFLTQKLLPLIADGGRIVNISSGLARFATSSYAAYASMKGAIEVFTRYLAKELGPRGIAANTVAPGAIETDFGGGRLRDNAQLNAFVAQNTALGRTGQPDDIAEVAVFLASDASRWLTGEKIVTSGGLR
jgi:NAD(P)-dependent dehydrogenase (short-subunit alcohol dehydrogenase family)